jgi:short-subunit dehydrogenase
VLVARREAALRELADELHEAHGVDVAVHAADLAVDDAPDALFEALAGTPIDILVNNAGVLSGGAFRKMDGSDIDNMIRLNIRALTQLCRLFVEPMIERGHGRIMNVASIAAFQSVPTLAVYAATKAYVLSLGESLSVELGRRGVTVTTVCPGLTDTDMLHGATGSRSDNPRMGDLLVLKPERVAQDAYRACMAGTAIKVPGLHYATASATTRLLPRWALRGAGRIALLFR